MLTTKLEITAEIERAKHLTDTELDNEFRAVIGIHAANMIRLAVLYAEKQRRGHVLSGLPTLFAQFLPAICEGTVLPEVFAALMDRPYLLHRVASLPPSEQKKLVVDQDPIEVAVLDGGKLTKLKIPVGRMEHEVAVRVFDGKRIRTYEEQAGRLAVVRQPAHDPIPKEPTKIGKVTVDRATQVVRIGRSVAPAADVIEALRKQRLIA